MREAATSVVAPMSTTPAVSSPARLETLAHYDILDTPPEAEFDDLASLAATLCQTPVALVSLVAETRQWFKARVGFGRSETPIVESVCAYVVEGRAPLEISDLREDPRTAANPLVTGAPGIRFYAGEPLTAPDGEILGSLCVIDVEKRDAGLQPEQRAGLAALARQVMRLIEARRMIRRQGDRLLRQEEANAEAEARIEALASAQREILHRYRVVQEASAAGRVGTFEVDVLRNVAYPSALTCQLFGVEVIESCTIQTFFERIVPDDRPRASSLATRRTGAAASSVEYRVHADGSGAVRWLSRDAAFVRDRNGEVIRMIGTVQDITAEKEANARLEALVTLGDMLRGEESASRGLAEALPLVARTLGGFRVGRFSFDRGAPGIVVSAEWVAPGARSMLGTQSLGLSHDALARLQAGASLVVDAAERAGLGETAAFDPGLGIGAYVVAPLLQNGVLEGGLFVHRATAWSWTIEEVNFLEAVADRFLAVLAIGREQERREMVAREITHRLKNTLAIVQALAKQTLRPVTEQNLVEVFERRLMALGRAHDLLFAQDWRNAWLGPLIEQALGYLGMLGRVRMHGPEVALGPEASTALSLVLHELGTNAIKYGAWSAPGGEVLIAWQIVPPQDGGVGCGDLTLCWEERGGPVVRPPERSGLGSRLIKAGFGGTGRTEVVYAPEGLQARFRAGLAEVGPG